MICGLVPLWNEGFTSLSERFPDHGRNDVATDQRALTPSPGLLHDGRRSGVATEHSAVTPFVRAHLHGKKPSSALLPDHERYDVSNKWRSLSPSSGLIHDGTVCELVPPWNEDLSPLHPSASKIMEGMVFSSIDHYSQQIWKCVTFPLKAICLCFRPSTSLLNIHCTCRIFEQA